MASRMANAARRIMHSVGFKRKTSIPFGAYWEDDIWGLTQGRTAMTIVDVGANIGQTAHKLVQRFPDATVYSFEPVPTTFAELKANTADLSDVHCVHCALGDFVGQAQITTHRGGRNSVFSVAGAAAESTTAIQVNTLDAFCAEIDWTTSTYSRSTPKGSNHRYSAVPANCSPTTASISSLRNATSSVGPINPTATSSKSTNYLPVTVSTWSASTTAVWTAGAGSGATF